MMSFKVLGQLYQKDSENLNLGTFVQKSKN